MCSSCLRRVHRRLPCSKQLYVNINTVHRFFTTTVYLRSRKSSDQCCCTAFFNNITPSAIKVDLCSTGCSYIGFSFKVQSTIYIDFHFFQLSLLTITTNSSHSMVKVSYTLRPYIQLRGEQFTL